MPLLQSLLSQVFSRDLKVPFLSSLDAEVACLHLSCAEGPLEEVVHKEIRVTGSDPLVEVLANKGGA